MENTKYKNKGKFENADIEKVRKDFIKSGMILLKTNKDITNFLTNNKNNIGSIYISYITNDKAEKPNQRNKARVGGILTLYDEDKKYIVLKSFKGNTRFSVQLSNIKELYYRFIDTDNQIPSNRKKNTIYIDGKVYKEFRDKGRLNRFIKTNKYRKLEEENDNIEIH